MNMKIVASVLIALGTGAAIAVQSSLNGRAGAVIGPIRTGLLVNALGGSVALLVLTGLFLAFGVDFLGGSLPKKTGLEGGGGIGQVILIAGSAGLLGILIIVGISFAVQRVGVTAGLSAVILAQLVVGMLIDSSGLGGAGAIAADPRRIIGVLVMALGVYLLVPKT